MSQFNVHFCIYHLVFTHNNFLNFSLFIHILFNLFIKRVKCHKLIKRHEMTTQYILIHEQDIFFIITDLNDLVRQELHDHD